MGASIWSSDGAAQTAGAIAGALAAQAAAEAAQTAAETAQTGAQTARTGAETARTGAETARTGAETAKTNAETAETNAETAETNAETAQAAAEAARDASWVNNNIFVDTTAGLAATVNGEYFSVPSADSDEYLILYRNETGVAVQKKIYPSAGGVMSTVTAVQASVRATTDLLATIVWNADTLLWNDGSTTVFAGYSASDAITVTAGDILRINCGLNHAAQTINVAAYDATATFDSALLSGGVPVSTDTGARADNDQYIVIPSNITSIKIGAHTTSEVTVLDLVSAPERYYVDNLQARLKTSSESNLLAFDRYYPTTAGAIATASGSNTKGSGYVPVSVGDTLKWYLKTAASVYGVALYNAGKVFLRFLEENSSAYADGETVYTLNSVNEPTVAYAVAGVSDNSGTIAQAYFYVSSANSLARKIDNLSSDILRQLGWRRSVPTLSTTAALTLTDNGDGTTGVLVNSTPNFLVHTRSLPKDSQLAKGIMISYVRVDGGGPCAFSWNTGTYKSDAVTLANSETAVVWCEHNDATSLRCDTASVTYTILATFAVEFPQNVYDALDTPNWPVLADSLSVGPHHTYSDKALDAVFAKRLKTEFYGKSVAFFGNSLQYGLWPTLETYLGVTTTDCTLGGSDAQSNLTDFYLALIPADVDLVTISSGSGSNAPDAGYRADPGGITSRNRNYSEGALNYAIDYISTNMPAARILLISPVYCAAAGRDNTSWAACFEAIAAYRQLPLADCWNDSDISARNFSQFSSDTIHLDIGTEGLRRQGGVIAGKLRSLSW